MLFVADCVETALRFVLTELTRLLTVVTLLLTAKTAPLFGIAVRREASPAKRP